MANLKDCPKFQVKNNYYTQKKMWENILHLVPKDKIIWESCMLNSKSKSMDYWREFGYEIVGNTEWDMLNCEIPNYDICITNIPFETKIKKKILKKLVEIDKPFIIIMNTTNIFAKYIREIFKDNIKYLQVVIPQGKILFEEYNEEEEKMVKCKKQASFYCSYVCYKMNIPQEELFLK